MSSAHPRLALAPTLAAAAVIGALTSGCLPPPRSASSAAPTPSAATSSVAPAAASPRESATPNAHDLAIAAFAERVSGGKLTYRIAFTGTVRASADTLAVAGSMDVSGADFASSFTYDFSRDYRGLGKFRVEVRAVRGKGYIKRGSAAWQPIKGYAVAQSYVPFTNVDAADDVRYLGAVEVGDATFHKVSVAGAVLIHPNTIPYQIQKEKVDDTVLEVVIDDAGRPRSGTWKLWGQARVGEGAGQLQRVVYELDLTFSKVGARLSIKRP